MKQPVTSHSKLQMARTCEKQLQASRAKKSFFLCGWPMTRSSMVSDSVNFHLKQNIPLIEFLGYNLKSSFSKIIALSEKLDVKMTPSWVLRDF